MRQFQCVPTTYVTEILETYFELYIYQEPRPLSLVGLLNIPNCQSVLKYLNVYVCMKAVSPNLSS